MKSEYKSYENFLEKFPENSKIVDRSRRNSNHSTKTSRTLIKWKRNFWSVIFENFGRLREVVFSRQIPETAAVHSLLEIPNIPRSSSPPSPPSSIPRGFLILNPGLLEQNRFWHFTGWDRNNNYTSLNSFGTPFLSDVCRI